VLAESTLGEAYLRVRTEEQLRALPLLPHITAYDISGDFDLSRYISEIRHAQSLYLQGDALTVDLRPLAGLPSLGLLGLDSLRALDDLSPLADTAVNTLYLFRLRPDLDLSPLRRMRSLSHVNIDYPLPGGTLDTLPMATDLTGLGLFDGARNVDISGIERWPLLNWLTLTGADQGAALVRLAALSDLTTLQLIQQPHLDLAELEPLHGLQELWLSDCDVSASLAALRELPALTSLHLAKCGPSAPLDLSPLADLDGLTITVEDATPLRGVQRFPPERLVLGQRIRSMPRS
jgi:hypothetical protein